MPQHHLVIANAVQIAHAILVSGKIVFVVTHNDIGPTAPVSVAMANAYFDSVKALWQAQLAALCQSTTVFSRVEMRDLRAPGMPLVVSTSPSVGGTAPAGDTLPRQIAACLTVRTNRAGRQFRGRMYWTGFSESANGPDNHMTTAAKTALDAFAAGFVTAASPSGSALAVAHRPTAFDEITGLPISPGLGFLTPATQVVCRDAVWDTQRRRAE